MKVFLNKDTPIKLLNEIHQLTLKPVIYNRRREFLAFGETYS